MRIDRDNSSEDVVTRIIYALYIYSLINIKRKLWLSGEQVVMYAEMLNAYVSGVDTTKHGWIKELPLKAMANKKYKYIYVERIKKKLWLKKDKGTRKFVFPPKVVELVEIIRSGKSRVFSIKV